MVYQRVRRAVAGSRAERLFQHRGEICVACRLYQLIGQQCWDSVFKVPTTAYGRFLVVSGNSLCFLNELVVFTGSQRWIHFASVPPPSASSNEWVPVFRAQAAAMNKMAFKAFFITAFSQTERGSCRASDGFRLGKLDVFDYLYPQNA